MPAIARDPFLVTPVLFAWAVRTTSPLPVWPPVAFTQGSLEEVIHEHPDKVVTVTDTSCPPKAFSVSGLGGEKL